MHDNADVDWPSPWVPIRDDGKALEFGKSLYADVIPSVLGELQREICDRHPLYGFECAPIAYHSRNQKEFLFLTNKPGAPVVLVHFTWHQEPDPLWPMVVSYKSIEDFILRETEHNET